MGIINWIRNFFGYIPGDEWYRPVSRWYQVRFDDERVYVSASPEGREPWKQQFEWNTVIRVCFRAEGPCVSDGIYVFTNTREESYVIPMEAAGGEALWHEIVRRGLFDAILSIKAMGGTGGELFCWPSIEDS